METLSDVFSAGLVKESERDSLVEGPPEVCIVFSFHENDEQGQVGCVAPAITIQVGLDTHLVTIATCVERRAVDGGS